MGRMVRLLGMALALAWATAGCPTADNEDSCERGLERLDGLDCADGHDWGIDCEDYTYDEYPCDLEPYFDCLVDETTCDEDLGVPVMASWASCVRWLDCD